MSYILEDPERVMKRVHVEQHSASYGFDVSFSNLFLPFLPHSPCSFSQIVQGNLHSYSIKATFLFHSSFCETPVLMGWNPKIQQNKVPFMEWETSFSHFRMQSSIQRQMLPAPHTILHATQTLTFRFKGSECSSSPAQKQLMWNDSCQLPSVCW